MIHFMEEIKEEEHCLVVRGCTGILCVAGDISCIAISRSRIGRFLLTKLGGTNLQLLTRPEKP